MKNVFFFKYNTSKAVGVIYNLSIILGLYQFKGENGTSVHFTANQVEIVWVSGPNTFTIDFFGMYLL